MSLLTPRTWGITARLVLVATVPAVAMFVVVSASLYVIGRDEVERALQERGELFASALAETSYYAVMSGNLSYLDRNVRELVKADPGVASVEVLDALRQRLVAVQATPALNGIVFERPIRMDVPDISLFEQSEPHVSAAPSIPDGFRRSAIAGYVRVEMSDAPILRSQKRRLILSGLLVLIAAVGSGFIGLYLARTLQAPLGAVMRALRQIRGGDFDVGLTRQAAGELGELQQAIGDMAAGLSLQRHELEALVDERTRELQEAVEKVSVADADKRRLLARTNRVLEEERQRIGVEIHDELNASLIVLGLKAQQIAALARLVEDRETGVVISNTARDIEATTHDIYTAARQIVKQLRPEVIDTLGLRSAITEMVRGYDELQSECSFKLFVGEEFPELRGQAAIAAYRLVQEALSNVVKHAHASNAWVKLDRHESLPLLLIVVADDGRGFYPAAQPKDSFGLLGMRERVLAGGGSLAIDTAPGKGTTVSIRLPLETA